MFCQRKNPRDFESFEPRLDKFFRTRARVLAELAPNHPSLQDIMIKTLGEAHHRYSVLQLGKPPQLAPL